jgi:hypothetical protein
MALNIVQKKTYENHKKHDACSRTNIIPLASILEFSPPFPEIVIIILLTLIASACFKFILSKSCLKESARESNSDSGGEV